MKSHLVFLYFGFLLIRPSRDKLAVREAVYHMSKVIVVKDAEEQVDDLTKRKVNVQEVRDGRQAKNSEIQMALSLSALSLPVLLVGHNGRSKPIGKENLLPPITIRGHPAI